MRRDEESALRAEAAEANTADFKLLTMRVPLSLYEQVQRDATNRGGCSVSSSARYILEQGLTLVQKEKA